MESLRSSVLKVCTGLQHRVGPNFTPVGQTEAIAIVRRPGNLFCRYTWMYILITLFGTVVGSGRVFFRLILESKSIQNASYDRAETP
jgi:hypothetical protein